VLAYTRIDSAANGNCIFLAQIANQFSKPLLKPTYGLKF